MYGDGKLTEALLQHGGGTFVALLLSWALPRFTCLALDKLRGAAPQVASSPPPTPAARRAAWRQVVLCWLLAVLPVVVAAAPLTRRLFPADAELPVWWQALIMGLGSLMLHDIGFFIDSRTVGVVAFLHRRVSQVPKLLQGPFAWGGRCAHPSELYLQAVDAVVGPALCSCLFTVISLHAWWAWLALIQFMWVLDRSNYAPPSPSALVAMVTGMQQGKKRRSKGAKEAGRAGVREAAQKRVR